MKCLIYSVNYRAVWRSFKYRKGANCTMYNSPKLHLKPASGKQKQGLKFRLLSQMHSPQSRGGEASGSGGEWQPPLTSEWIISHLRHLGSACGRIPLAKYTLAKNLSNGCYPRLCMNGLGEALPWNDSGTSKFAHKHKPTSNVLKKKKEKSNFVMLFAMLILDI